MDLGVAPAGILQALIRFDTTNPPGNEGACISYLERLLRDGGLSTALYARDPARPNLIARLPGRGEASPLLLYGHVDVVPAAGQAWEHPPFAAELIDGWVWGRGALDMKGPLAMMVAALLHARDEGLVPPGDVIFAALADEEGGSNYGARYLVEAHPGLFSGVRYAVGEFGGFTFNAAGRKFYPVMIGEKQTCVVRATFHGQGGHTSVPEQGGAMARLARALLALDRARLPVHVTTPARLMIEGMAAAMPLPQRLVLGQLANPRLANGVLGLLGPAAPVFSTVIRNSVCATSVQADGGAVNVIPPTVALCLHARMVPGCSPDLLLAELGAVLGRDAALEVVSFDPGPGDPDMTLFPTLAAILREVDPGGYPVPLLLPATTDARFLARLGIQTYGFTPMPLPPGLDFWRLAHGADERIPAKALAFGAGAIYSLLARFGRA